MGNQQSESAGSPRESDSESASDASGDDYLWKHILRGNYTKVKRFFKSGCKVDWESFLRRGNSTSYEDGVFGIHSSSRLPLQALLKRCRTGRNMTKCKKFIKLLLENGLDPNLIDNEGKTALNHLITNVNYFRLYVRCYRQVRKLSKVSCEVLAMLGEHGASMISGQEYDSLDRSPLHYAAMYNFTDSTQVFAKHGSDLELNDAQGKTPLHIAAENCSFSVLRDLIRCGCDMVTKTNDDETVLHLIIKGATTEINCALVFIEYFVRSGVDVNARDVRGNTALHLAARIGTDDKIIAQLVRNGADVDAVNNKGRSPLFEYLNGTDLLSYPQVEVTSDQRLPVEYMMGFACLLNNMTDFQHIVCDRDGRTPITLQDPRAEDLLTRLLDKSLRPTTLQHLCRQAIRNSIGINKLIETKHLKTLGLPGTLENYVCSVDYVDTLLG
ncbi:ankyrin repeat domain-containing protein 61-like [Saccoglossus kowalevskii]|uniref:Serine/threonine-protein phosphatase 6 regulatory ankyrin repeat subunit B-like n=1 Tax=Saccoglossus kowalevskii TaxID=10224 RepID=A0ABM0MYN5_SACKO|nr:PREDICTED: serine/threonine-protein phosphatase 6 regulatory ankyrin repeat subunit B-like [Saccoglossus kowalevskii]